MTTEDLNLIKEINEQALVFKSRAHKSPDSRKRHDPPKRDEKKWMRIASRQLGWHYSKIGGVFDRDWRTVKNVIMENRTRRRAAVPQLFIGLGRTSVLTDGLDYARFASVQVSATDVEAKGCWGWVKVLPSGPTMPLHWRNSPFEEEQTEPSRIFIKPEAAAVLDVAFSVPLPATRTALQDAGPCREVPVYFQGSTRGPIPWAGQGCWLARPSALENPDPGLEAYLPPGKYSIEVGVGSGSGQGDVRRFILSSPESWEALDLNPV
jgi:hypothetical protein